MHKPIRMFITLLCLCGLPHALSAQSICETDTPSYESLQDLYMRDCFTEHTLNQILQQVNEQLPEQFDMDQPGATRVRSRQLDSAMAFLLEGLQRQKDSNTTGSPVIPFEMLMQRRRIAALEGPGTIEDWVFDSDEGVIGTTGIDIRSFLLNNCEVQTDNCQVAFDNALYLLRTSEAMAEISLRSDNNTWRVFQSETGVVREQWRNYLFGARSQFFWELKINSALYDRHRDKTEAFPTPPNHQWIVFHPELALEYVDDADRGSRFEPAIVMEWLGYNRLQWSGSDMRRPLGLSLVSTYSDRAGSKTVGYGLQLHYDHHYSLGITTRDGDLGIFMSVDLGKYLINRKEQLQSAKESFKLRTSTLENLLD